MKKAIYAGIMALALTSCASFRQERLIRSLTTLKPEDVAAARDMAIKYNDPQAVLCLDAGYTWLSRELPLNEPTVGPVSRYERLRLIRRMVDAGVPENVHNECSPIASDARLTVFKVLRLFAGLR